MEKSIKTAIKQATSYDDLCLTLKQLKFADLTSSDVYLIDKTVKKLAASLSPAIKIAYVGNYTLDSIPPYVNTISSLEHILLGEYVGGYNQYFQEVLDPKSGLIQYDPDLIKLSLSMRELSPQVYYEFSSLAVGERKKQLNQIISGLSEWAEVAVKNTSATVLIDNFINPSFKSAGIADVNQEYGESEFYLELNLELLRLFTTNSRVHIFDIDRLASRFGKAQVHDPKMYYIAKMEWREQFLPSIAEEMLRYIKAIKNVTKKCLVLDLDNTLWGGVVGEEGALGVKVGHGDPQSEAFLDFQYKIKSVKNRGIILGICSKNNPEDALEVFDKRSEMPLQKDDFSVREINWQPKHENIKNIAKTLNIGTDSIVFIDDNPAECSLVQQMLPEVQTILLPKDPATYPSLIDAIDGFEKIQILQDDLRKTTQYLENQQREEHKKHLGDLSSYLESLETEITIGDAAESDLPRVHQLFTKTNQFNLTTIRYSMGDVEKFFRSPDYQLTVVAAKDRFGDLGTIGLYLLRLDRPEIAIDSFIMSCRVMGRAVETAMMNQIKSQHLVGKENVSLVGTYIPTKKNKPVENFFAEQGFETIDRDETGKKIYTLEPGNAKLAESSWIKVLLA